MTNLEREALLKWEPLISSAVEIAEEYPELYRREIFRLLTKQSSGQGSGGPTPPLGVNPEVSTRANARAGLAALADAISVDTELLRRVIEVDVEGRRIQILAPRIGGASTSDNQNRYCAVYCLAREKTLGEAKTGIEALRSLCRSKGCYDTSNFTQNFRNQDLLREVPAEGNGERAYILSSEGLETAKELLRSLSASD